MMPTISEFQIIY